MRTYEVLVKTPPIYGRDGIGKSTLVKVDAIHRAAAAVRGIKQFILVHDVKDLVGRSMMITVSRVI